MSRIDELIQEFCPDGVEYVSLESVAKTIPGLTGKTKADFSDGNARYVTYKNAFSNLTVDDAASDFVKFEDGERQNALRIGDVVITGSSENVDEVGMSSVVVREPAEPLYLNSFCFALRFERPVLLPEFSKYLFRGEAVRKQIRKSASGVTRINVSKPRFMKVRIPVPPTGVQREIVGVLDKFTRLETELTAELEARRQQRVAALNNQFVAQRDHRRSPDSSAPIPLGKLTTQHVEPIAVVADESYTNLGVKWYGEGAFAREAKLGSEIKAKTLYRVRAGQFIYNRMFVTEGSFGIVTPELEHGVVSNEFPVFEVDRNRVMPEWLYLKFRDPWVVATVAGQASGGTKSRRRWKEDQFNSFEIELPSLLIQREMVRVHDHFLALERSIEQELIARRAQYEHYRDRLLAFKELVA